MKIVFFGTQDWAAEYLKALLNDPDFEVVAVVTQPDSPMGRKKLLVAPPTKVAAAEHNVPVYQPTKLKDEHFQALLKNTGAELGIVIAYGRILPDAIVNFPKLGIVNVHPSLLPKWRGPSPVQAAIAAGDTETGVTIMKIDTQMDHGPILSQIKLPLAPDETLETYMHRVVQVGVPVFLQSLKDYASGKLVPREQDHEQATFCKLLAREDGMIDWTQPAQAIERKIRAYNPWPGTTSGDLKIFKARHSDITLAPGEQQAQDGHLLVGTGTTALEILELQPAGGRRMAAADYLRGRHLGQT